jgi:hypothetical protein
MGGGGRGAVASCEEEGGRLEEEGRCAGGGGGQGAVVWSVRVWVSVRRMCCLYMSFRLMSTVRLRDQQLTAVG